VAADYLQGNIERQTLQEKATAIAGTDMILVASLLERILFVDQEIRLHVSYESVQKGKRIFKVSGKRGNGRQLRDFLDREGIHTFSNREFKHYMTQYMLPEFIFDHIQSRSGRAKVKIYVGMPDEAYVQGLSAKGFKELDFRKADKEKQYHNRKLYYREAQDGSFEVEFLNMIGYKNLRHVIENYLTLVDEVTVIR
jgi:hypothetical protein